jgi:Uma2 family endonuclease
LREICIWRQLQTVTIRHLAESGADHRLLSPEAKLGKLYDAPFDVYLGEHDVFQPDILFVSNARNHILTEAGAKGAPDLIVEILSQKPPTRP